MHHRVLAVLLVSLSFSTAAAQYDAARPEPVGGIGGTVIVHDGEELSHAVGSLIEELADDGAAVVTISGAAVEDAGALVAHVAGGGVLVVVGEGVRALNASKVIPGAFVTVGFETEEGRARLFDVLGRHPDAVGLGVHTGGTLVVRGRRLFGQRSGATAVVEASERRALREERLRGREGADLVALSRSARARLRPTFPAAEPPKPAVPNGRLVIAGGGGLSAAVIGAFLEGAGGLDAPIVYVPCTESVVVDPDPGMVRMLRKSGATNVRVFHTKDRTRADEDEAFLAPLKEAKGVWFGGGRQWNFVDSYQHTEAHRLMHDVLARGGVIGGSSAGASIQADYMARGDPLGNLNIIAEGYEEGLGFLRGCAIDQHFTQRGRQRDMVELKTAFPQLLGIGLDEGVAIVVEGSAAEVIGPRDGRAWFYASDDPIVVPPGATFDLASRRRLF